MLRIKPFCAWRPTPAHAPEVAAVPYDVVNHNEALALVANKPRSFLRISRAEIELPTDLDPYAPEVYARANDNFQSWQQDGTLIQDATPTLYLYRLRQGQHLQDGIMACCHVDDYRADVIKKHEKTRQEKEDDRTRHIDTLSAHTGPVLLTYRDVPAINQLMAKTATQTPLYDFQALDGIQHTIWAMTASDATAVQAAFTTVSTAYIADGHHRAASSVRVAEKRRAAAGLGADAIKDAESNWFMALLFPAANLKVLPYNRVVRDLNALTVEQLLDSASRNFLVTNNASPTPPAPGHISMYLAGKWYGLQRRIMPQQESDPVKALDVSALQDYLLAPALGINNPRTDTRIDFVGGARGAEALQHAVYNGEAAVAFSMYPVTVAQLMAIADHGLTMPPKSTWFEPKPRSGLLIHAF